MTNLFHDIKDFESVNDTPKNRIQAIEMGLLPISQEELASICIRTTVGHWQDTPCIVLHQIRTDIDITIWHENWNLKLKGPETLLSKVSGFWILNPSSSHNHSAGVRSIWMQRDILQKHETKRYMLYSPVWTKAHANSWECIWNLGNSPLQNTGRWTAIYMCTYNLFLLCLLVWRDTQWCCRLAIGT